MTLYWVGRRLSVIWVAVAVIPAVPAAADTTVPQYRRDVAPILERRCVVCHACFDAPCQLDLGSWEGIARGASATRVYDGTRLLATAPTRLRVDAQAPAAWRELGFHAVIDECGRGGRDALRSSLLFRYLALKREHPLPAATILPDAFDFSLDRAQQCVAIDAFEHAADEAPLAGMPYGLPAIDVGEETTIADWLAAGAPVEPRAPLPGAVRDRVARWEAFLNAPGRRARLMSRYLFEHLFLGHLYLEGDGERYWFRLIRSNQPPGEDPEPIATRQPFDDPGDESVFYRLVRLDEAFVAKTHMPYRLDPARMQRWRELFLDGQAEPERLPGYDARTAANPFIVFRDIPVASRYRFLLDDAGYFVAGFIKGPVCRGQVALNVINDRFWVFFADPATHTAAADRFLARHADTLALPAEDVSSLPLASWSRYQAREAEYLDARAKFMRRTVGSEIPLDLTVVWDGDGRNPNAALTVFRHFDSASVITGLLGTPPKTAWLITYPILERIHYLLVAGFDVFGNVGHQLNSRLYMDFLRMEAETNLLALLPLAARPQVVDHWYRGEAEQVREKFYRELRRFGVDSAIHYRSDDPLAELYGLLRQRVAPVDRRWRTAPGHGTAIERPLARLAGLVGGALQWLPETAFLRVVGREGPVDLTLLRNSAHTNISHPFAEQSRRLPDEDTLTVAAGLLGAHPNVFFRVPAAALAEFVDAVAALDGEAAYSRLADRFAVRRTDRSFWRHLDDVHRSAREADPLAFGLLDLNRLENR